MARHDARVWVNQPSRALNKMSGLSMNKEKERVHLMKVDNNPPKEVVIPKEQAVFWMDERGRWCNRHGPFEHQKIIAFFNRSIGKDEGGYYVCQEREGLREKVYFRYHVTPIVAVDVLEGEPDRLVLNTGKIVSLSAEGLVIQDDHLYLRQGGECIKISERVLLKYADRLKYAEGTYSFRAGEIWLRVPEFTLRSET